MTKPTSAPRRHCEVCGRELNRNNQSGICGNHDSPECMKARKQRARAADPKPPPHRIAIRAGDTFGQWTALEDYSVATKRVVCRCTCGTKRSVDGGRLLNGYSTSCGCKRHRRRENKPPYLLAGMTFGRLTLLEDVAYCEDRAHCRCKCGTEMTAPAIQVKLGGTRSCGCIRREARRTHGFSKHPLYYTWHGIIDRCTNPKNHSHYRYGGRGITVCDRWRKDPWAFAEDIYREIGPRPEGKDANGRALYELDRTDNELGYQPGNVRWADKKTQRANQRTVDQATRERDEARRERDEAIRERDAFAAEVDRLTALLASRKPRMSASIPKGIVLF